MVQADDEMLAPFMDLSATCKCVVIDDAQNFECCLKRTWIAVFERMKAYNNTKLYIFADSEVQNYKPSFALKDLIGFYLEVGEEMPSASVTQRVFTNRLLIYK